MTMASTDEPVYSRDEVVSEVTAFYEFCIGLWIPESALKRPPPGGWPDIDNKRYAWLGKDDTVIDLMRHLPFIYKEDHSKGHEIYTLTAAVDYNGPYALECMELGDTFNIEPGEGLSPLPPYVLTLAAETSGGDGGWILVNTKRGTVTLYEPEIGPHKGFLGVGNMKNDVSTNDQRRESSSKLRNRCLISPPKTELMRNGETMVLGEPKNFSGFLKRNSELLH